MLLDILNKILCFPQKAFLRIFTDENTKQKNLISLTLKDFQVLARPKTLSGNTLSIFDYDNNIIKDALYYIKNRKDVGILSSVCQIASEHLLEELVDREVIENFRDPVIVSIPSTRKHIIQRGYNPADMIAKSISNLTSLPYTPQIIIKSRTTPAQKTLSRYERLKNVKNSMIINSKLKYKIDNKCVIIIDDVMTTGATIQEAKRVLLKSGAKKVIGLVLAH